MKLPTWLVAALLLVPLAAPARAGGTSTQSIGGSGGLVIPMGDFSEVAGTGWFLGGSYQYRFHPAWAAGVDLDYFSFGETSASETLIGGTRTSKQSAYGGQSQFYAKYFLPLEGNPYEPYVKAGYFHYRIGFKTSVAYRGATSESTDKEKESGFGIGVGASRKLDDRSRVGAEILYSQFQTPGDPANLWQFAVTYGWRLGK